MILENRVDIFQLFCKISGNASNKNQVARKKPGNAGKIAKIWEPRSCVTVADQPKRPEN
jgi:hypothetical protein